MLDVGKLTGFASTHTREVGFFFRSFPWNQRRRGDIHDVWDDGAAEAGSEVFSRSADWHIRM